MANTIKELVGALRKQDDIRRELVANVSHELRRPLTTLQLSIETFLENRDKSENCNQPLYLEQALGCSNELSNLIQDLFELSCLDARESLPEASLFDLKELCQDMLEVFSLKHKERSISFNTCGSLDSYIVKADEVLILRALSNLVENAVKYSSITDTIEISLALRGDEIHVSVKDTGIGIRIEEIPLVFERFYRSAGKSRTSSAGTQVESGAGLGLAITKRIVELHGSSITLLSEPGVRTEFSFSLGHSAI